MFRVNDLVGPDVATADVLAVLAAAGVPVVERGDPVATTVLAVVTPTAAGTVVTLQRRGSAFACRGAVRRCLVRQWEDLAIQWCDPPRGRSKPS